MLVSPSRRLLAAGAAGNAGVIAGWALSRTAGLPVGPEPWTPEPATLLDGAATAFELGVVAGSLILLMWNARERRPSTRAALRPSPPSRWPADGRPHRRRGRRPPSPRGGRGRAARHVQTPPRTPPGGPGGTPARPSAAAHECQAAARARPRARDAVGRFDRAGVWLNASDAEISAVSWLGVLVCGESTARGGGFALTRHAREETRLGARAASLPPAPRRARRARGSSGRGAVRDPARDRRPGRDAGAGARLPARAAVTC